MKHPADTRRSASPPASHRKPLQTTANHRKLRPPRMPDVFTPAKRSEVMSRIRSTGNAATELRLVALMRTAGITGWRRHVQLPLGTTARSAPPSSSSSSKAQRSTKSEGGSTLAAPGKAKARAKARAPTPATRPLRVRPDFIFRTQRVAVFVDGCFWHGCPRHATRPRQNRKFWDEKIARNHQRDLLVTRRLRQRGWTVLRLWECALTRQQQTRTLARLRRALEK